MSAGSGGNNQPWPGASAPINLANARRSGLMDKGDKARLDSLATITSVAAPLTLTGGALDIQAATASLEGSMSAADKAKLDALIPNYVRVYNTAAIATASGTSKALPFDSNRQISHAAMHSTTTNTERLVAVTTGWHMFGANVQWATSAAGERVTMIRLAGANGLARVQGAGLATTLIQNVSGGWYMTAGDYIEVVVVQTSGGALNVAAPAGSDRYACEAWLALVLPG